MKNATGWKMQLWTILPQGNVLAKELEQWEGKKATTALLQYVDGVLTGSRLDWYTVVTLEHETKVRPLPANTFTQKAELIGQTQSLESPEGKKD